MHLSVVLCWDLNLANLFWTINIKLLQVLNFYSHSSLVK